VFGLDGKVLGGIAILVGEAALRAGTRHGVHEIVRRLHPAQRLSKRPALHHVATHDLDTAPREIVQPIRVTRHGADGHACSEQGFNHLATDVARGTRNKDSTDHRLDYRRNLRGIDMPHFVLSLDIEAPPEDCFDLVLNVDVQRSLGDGMAAVAGVTTGPLHVGDTVTWRARHFGVVWHMTSEIVDLDRPRSFQDEMLRGPFGSWHHRHEFLPTAQGTRMVDDIRYTAPFGPLGWMADHLVLESYLRRLLARRNRDLKALAERGVAA
jgi:ligand-binding SRPBCC domain-containing protein